MDIFGDKVLTENREVDHLFKMINFDKFLPIKGCYEWVLEHYKDKNGFPQADENGYVGKHPSSFGHRKFSEEVIIPYLKEKNLI